MRCMGPDREGAIRCAGNGSEHAKFVCIRSENGASARVGPVLALMPGPIGDNAKRSSVEPARVAPVGYLEYVHTRACASRCSRTRAPQPAQCTMLSRVRGPDLALGVHGDALIVPGDPGFGGVLGTTRGSWGREALLNWSRTST